MCFRTSGNIANSKNSDLAQIIELDIGGVRYKTTKQTLIGDGKKPNFFTGLLNSGLDASLRDPSGAYFIDREGKYFAPILEYLRTGEVFLPKDMPPQFVAREAQYYGIDMPINDVVETSMMSFITDEWLENRQLFQDYNAVRDVADGILSIVLTEFKSRSDRRQPIMSPIFTSRSLKYTPKDLERWTQKCLFSNDDDRKQWIVALELAWQQAVINDTYYKFLDSQSNRNLLKTYCAKNGLTIDIQYKTGPAILNNLLYPEEAIQGYQFFWVRKRSAPNCNI
jgi:hypothetical protein